MNNVKKMAVFLFLSAMLGGALTACNTVEGLGRDATAAGSAITGAAQKTRSY